MADHGPSSGIASSYPVECMPRRPFPRYVACGTDTRQRRPSALSCCRPRTRVDLRRRREHADRVRNVAVCCPVGLVPPASCAASTLSTGVLTQHAAPTMAWTCSFAEQMTGMRQVVRTAACTDALASMSAVLSQALDPIGHTCSTALRLIPYTVNGPTAAGCSTEVRREGIFMKNFSCTE